MLNSYVKKGYFEQPVEIKQEEDGFYFAVAVTAKQNFQDDTTENFEVGGGEMSLRYVISGGDADGDSFEIPMAPCTDLNFYRPSGVEHIDRVAAAHIAIP